MTRRYPKMTELLNVHIEFAGVVKVAQVSEVSPEGHQRIIPPTVQECLAFTLAPTNRKLFLPLQTLEYMPRATHVLDSVMANPAITRLIIGLQQ